MTIVLPLPDPQFYGCTATPRKDGGYDLSSITGSVTLLIDKLVEGHTITFSASVWYERPGAILFGDQRKDIPAKTWTTVTLAAAVDIGKLSVHLIAPGTLAGLTNIELIDNTDIGPAPRPCDVLSLQTSHPALPGTPTHRLLEVFDRAAFFDVTEWDATAHPEDGYRDVTRAVTAMKVFRGVSSSGPALSAQVGTLTIAARNGLRPETYRLTPGHRVQLIHWPTRELIFSGHIADLTISPEKSGGYTVEIVATDTVADLARIIRHGAKPDHNQLSEPWHDRLTRLMKSAPRVQYRLQDPALVWQFRTVWETNLAKHLDALVNSAPGYWMVERDNSVTVSGKRPDIPPAFEISDAAPTDLAARRWSPTDASLQWRFSDLITSITLTNHPAKIEGEGSDLAADDATTTIKGANADYGQTAAADVVVSPGILEATARRLIRAHISQSVALPRDVTITPAHPQGPMRRGDLMAAAAVIDPLTPIRATFSGNTARALITSVSHTITPTQWQTTLSLIPQEGPQ